jgi:hypothetical protein
LFIKQASWQVVNTIKQYYTWSSALEESGQEHWYPVEFNTKCVCWTEVHWIENLKIGRHWQAFHIAGEDLGLDIMLQDTANQD